MSQTKRTYSNSALILTTLCLITQLSCAPPTEFIPANDVAAKLTPSNNGLVNELAQCLAFCPPTGQICNCYQAFIEFIYD